MQTFLRTHGGAPSPIALNGSFFNARRMLAQYVANADYPGTSVSPESTLRDDVKLEAGVCRQSLIAGDSGHRDASAGIPLFRKVHTLQCHHDAPSFPIRERVPFRTDSTQPEVLHTMGIGTLAAS
jgi:hypothetical protein